MERFGFGLSYAFVPSDALLERVTISPITGSIASRAVMQAAIFRFAPNGHIHRHPTTVPQILAILDGAGEVSGSNGEFEPVAAGDAVYFEAGELHETRSAEGMNALIIEAVDLTPARTRHGTVGE